MHCARSCARHCEWSGVGKLSGVGAPGLLKMAVQVAHCTTLGGPADTGMSVTLCSIPGNSVYSYPDL